LANSAKLPAARKGSTVRLLGLLLAVLALAAACSTTRPGEPRATTAPPTAPAALDDCVGAGQARLVAMPHGPAAVLGRGPAGVVLSNQSDRNLCGWLPFGRVLAARGFQVLLYDYGIAGDLSDDIAAAVAKLHQLGARRVVLVGASQGGQRRRWWPPAASARRSPGWSASRPSGPCAAPTCPPRRPSCACRCCW